MQPPNLSGSSGNPTPGQSGDGLSAYFHIIFKHRGFFGYTVGAVFLISVIISFLIPKTYMATARILAPRENGPGLASLIAGADEALMGLAAVLNGNPTPSAVYVGILKSRSVADALIEKFNLKERYDERYIEDVYAELADHSIIEASKRDQLIIISVKDRDPRRAADMANAYVDTLNRLNRRLSSTQGKRKRIFLEGRLKDVRADLERAETDLKAFQEKYHLVAVEEQAKVAIEGAAEIKGQIVAAQTELEVYKQFGTEKQIEAVMLKARIEELQKQLEAIAQGEPPATGNPDASTPDKSSGFYVPFDDLPRLSMELMRLTRAAKVQEKLFALITAQYEMAQIEEAKDVDTVQVLDPAVVPQKKFGPRRRAIVASSTALALMAAVFLAFLLEYTGYWQTISAGWSEIALRLRNFISAIKARKK
jgi:tyrosine-protein kinase Etk/Wzc